MLISLVVANNLTYFFFSPARSRSIVNIQSNITLSAKEISLEDNSTLQMANDGVLRQRCFKVDKCNLLLDKLIILCLCGELIVV